MVSKGPPVRLDANSSVSYMPAGGGGIGDPFNRVPERVLEDVKDGYVSLEAANSDYGVVINSTESDEYFIDLEATEELRKKKKTSKNDIAHGR